MMYAADVNVNAKVSICSATMTNMQENQKKKVRVFREGVVSLVRKFITFRALLLKL